MNTPQNTKFSKGMLAPFLLYPTFKIFLILITFPIFSYMQSLPQSVFATIVSFNRLITAIPAFLLGVYAIYSFPKFTPPITLTKKQKAAFYLLYLLVVCLIEYFAFN